MHKSHYFFSNIASFFSNIARNKSFFARSLLISVLCAVLVCTVMTLCGARDCCSEEYKNEPECQSWLAKAGYNCNADLMGMYSMRQRLRGKIYITSNEKGAIEYRISLSSWHKGLFSGGWDNFFNEVYAADKFADYAGAKTCTSGDAGHIDISGKWSNMTVGLCLVRLSPDSENHAFQIAAADNMKYKCSAEKRSCICAYTQNNSAYSTKQTDVIGCVDEEFIGAKLFLNSFIAPPSSAIFLEQCRSTSAFGCSYDDWTRWFRRGGTEVSVFESPKAFLSRYSGIDDSAENQKVLLDMGKHPLFSIEYSADLPLQFIEDPGRILQRNKRYLECQSFDAKDKFTYCAALSEKLSEICVYKAEKGNENELIIGYGCVPRPGIVQSSNTMLIAVARPFIAVSGARYNALLPLIVNARPGQEIAYDEDGNGLLIQDLGDRVFALIRKSSNSDAGIASFEGPRCDIALNVGQAPVDDARSACKLKTGIEVRLASIYVFSHDKSYYTKINEKLKNDFDVLNNYLPKNPKDAPLREFFNSKDSVFQPYTRDVALLKDYGMFIAPLMPKLSESETVRGFKWDRYSILNEDRDACLSYNLVDNASKSDDSVLSKYYPSAEAVREREFCYKGNWARIAKNKEALESLNDEQKNLANNIMRSNMLCGENAKNSDFPMCLGVYQGEYKRAENGSNDAEIQQKASKLTNDKRLFCLGSEGNSWDFIGGGKNSNMAGGLVCDYLPARCPVLKSAVVNAGNAIWLQPTDFSNVGQGDCDDQNFEAQIDLSLQKPSEADYLNNDALKLAFEEANKTLLALKDNARKEGRNVRQSEVEESVALQGFFDKIRCEIKKPNGICSGYSYSQVLNSCLPKNQAEPSYRCGG